MLSDQNRAKFVKSGAQLRDEIGTDEVFDGLFRRGIGINVYVKL